MKSIAEYLEVVAPSFEGSTVKIILIIYGEAIIEEVFEIKSYYIDEESSEEIEVPNLGFAAASTEHLEFKVAIIPAFAILTVCCSKAS